VLEETIFEDRFHIVDELKRMGACIETDGKSKAFIRGVDRLLGCEVTARELRGGAALIIAGCMAQGETIVTGTHFIERGYEDICRDYQNLGVNIYRELINGKKET
jgi:UDP-N-acetylglucosamine 1-carboxyvinyltransferase